MQGNVKPLGDRVLLERLDGDGREEIRESGLIIPARDLSLRHGNTHRIPDTFRASVLAVSDGATKATQGALLVGDEVLVHTYDQTQDSTIAGNETEYGLLVSVEDIVGIIKSDETEGGKPVARLLSRALRQSSIRDLGFYRAADVDDE